MSKLKLSLPKDVRIAEGMPTRTADLARSIDDGIFDSNPDPETGRDLTPLEVLERQDPDNDQPEWLRGTNVLQRLMLAYGVRTRDDHVNGVRASTVADLYAAGGGSPSTPGRGAILFPLWIEQGMRMAMVGALGTDRFYQSTLLGSGSTVLNPANIAARITADPLQRSILGLLVGIQEIGDGRPYTTFHMSNDANKTTMRRVTEFSPPAVYRLTGTERVKNLKEHAIEIDISYKALRQYALPVLQQHLDYITQQSMKNKEQVAYETHRDGDGSSAASTNTNVSSLAGGVANTVTYQNILEFLRLYESDGDYTPTIAIGTSAVMAKFDGSNTGTGNSMTFGPIGMAMLAGQAARSESRLFPPMFARSYATANRMYFFDAATLRMVYTPVLVERDRVIEGRFEKIVISEETGFDHIRDGGRRSLDVAN